MTDNRLEVTCVRNILLRRDSARANDNLHSRTSLESVLDLCTESHHTTDKRGGKTTDDLVDGAKLPPRLPSRRVHQILAHGLNVDARRRNQSSRVRDRHFTFKTEVAVLFVLGNLRLNHTWDLVLENKLMFDGEALHASLVIPAVRVHDRSARPLLVRLKLPVMVTLRVAIERQGQLRIGRRNGDLLWRRRRLHLIRGNVVRGRLARDDFVLQIFESIVFILHQTTRLSSGDE